MLLIFNAHLLGDYGPTLDFIHTPLAFDSSGDTPPLPQCT